MTEATPFNPSSAKGVIRAQVAGFLLQALRDGDMKAIIARSADFYGPHTRTSTANILVIDRLARHASAIWPMDDSSAFV